MNKKKVLIISLILVLLIIFSSSTYAYWKWRSDASNKTNITFTTGYNFSCSADGGGNITQNDATLIPTYCTNSPYVIKRTVTTNVVNNSGRNIYMDLWLKVNNIGQELSNSQYFSYALTDSPDGCTSGTVLSSGTFNGKNNTTNNKVGILHNDIYATSSNKTYYLYIWLDVEETNNDTQNQQFNLELEGSCGQEPTANAGSSRKYGTYRENILNGSDPEYVENLIPVTLSASGDTVTVANTNQQWYSYSNKQWANAVLVKESGVNTRLYYKSNPGATITESDILAYYVWIPRYKYTHPGAITCGSVANASKSDIENKYAECFTLTNSTKATLIAIAKQAYSMSDLEATATVEQYNSDYLFSYLESLIYQYNNQTGQNVQLEYELISSNKITYTRQPVSFNIQFESATQTKSTGNTIGNNYYTHPAFTFGATELFGIWVGKFETSHDTLSISTSSDNLGTCNSSSCANYTGLRILPSVQSLRYNKISNFFYASRHMEDVSNPYGLVASNVDSHMMKNSEWGAVAYLSHSIYGKNSEVYLNDNNQYYTGCGANSTDVSSSNFTSDCLNQYGTVTTYNQSTTGNATGVFDMSGGSYEYVMGTYNNSNNYSGTYGTYAGFTSSNPLPDSKYYDNYPNPPFLGNINGTNVASDTNLALCTQEYCGGHALNEVLTNYDWFDGTKVWYAGIDGFGTLSFATEQSPWFTRGYGANYSGIFNSVINAGSANYYDTFRLVLAPEL